MLRVWSTIIGIGEHDLSSAFQICVYCERQLPYIYTFYVDEYCGFNIEMCLIGDQENSADIIL